MKNHVLHIEPYNHSATSKFVIEGYRVNGKRRRLFFSSRIDAERELQRLKLIQKQEGQSGTALGPEHRVEAARCIKLLAKYEKSLTDATNFLIACLQSIEERKTSWSVSRLITERVARLERSGRSVVHIQDIRQRLAKFGQTFGDRPAAEITHQEIEAWLDDLDLGEQSFNNFRGRLFSLFNFAVKRELIRDNPIRKIEPKLIRPSETQVIAPESLQRVLDNASLELLPALAISYFAGLRTAEILRLEWNDINLCRGFIEVRASKAKSAQRRLVPIEPNLKEWLSPYAGFTGKVNPHSRREYHLLISELFRSLDIKRIDNGGRHSFASYWLAAHNDSAALAARLGHSTSRLVYTIYRELVSPELSRVYWNITPTQPANVVALRT